MTATTATTVITPMMTPRSVRNERSLCAATARQATRRSSSPTISPSSGARAAPARGRGVVDLHLVPDAEHPEGLERSGDDLLPFLQPVDDLDGELRGDPGLHLPELHGAVLL